MPWLILAFVTFFSNIDLGWWWCAVSVIIAVKRWGLGRLAFGASEEETEVWRHWSDHMAKGSGARVSTVLEVESRDTNDTNVCGTREDTTNTNVCGTKPGSRQAKAGVEAIQVRQTAASVTVEIANVSPLGAIKSPGHIKWKECLVASLWWCPACKWLKWRRKGPKWNLRLIGLIVVESYFCNLHLGRESRSLE